MALHDVTAVALVVSSSTDRIAAMLLGYNTNGLAHHRLVDAIHLLADAGYQSVAITLDAGALDPYEDPVILRRQIAAVRTALDARGLARVVETGARYLLNPKKKHDPTLMDPDPARRALRVDFLRRAIDVSVALGASAVSFWSGALADPILEDAAMDRLVEALRPVLDFAAARRVRVAFEPEPGMFIDTFERFARLDERIDQSPFDLTVDLGHVHCVEAGDVADHVRAWGPRIANVHIEDMMNGVHEHLMFGEGTMDFPPIIRALHEAGFEGGLHVELSRHSHMATEAVCRSAAFLQPILAAARA
jgi:L-ribulose-5-phosphate 3-epimerase